MNDTAPVPPPEGSVTIWLGLLKRGDPAAATPLWNAYFARLVDLARTRLRTLPRAAADEEDVALSAFDSFCLGVGDGRFPRLDDRDDLWQVLGCIIARKASGLARYHTRQKRDVRRTGPLSECPIPDPSPDEVATVADQCAHLLGLLEEGRLREVAVWKMEGHTNAQIAAKLGRSVPAVERKLAAIRGIWKREGSR